MAKAPNEQAAAGMFSVEQAAALLGATTEELRLLSRRGTIPKIVNDELPQVRTVQAYVAHLRKPIVPLAEAADQIGVTPQMLRKVAADGFITLRSEGGVDLLDAFKGYNRWLRDEQRRASKSAAESGLKQARQREIELRIAERELRVIDIDEAIGLVDLVVGAYRAELGGLPSRVTRDVTVRRKIEAQVNGLLDRVAKVFSKGASALRQGGSALEPDAEAAS